MTVYGLVRRVGFSVVGLSIMLAMLIGQSACAPVTYNRYQTAQTLGKGEVKLLAAAAIAHDLTAPAAFDISDDMDTELLDWSRDHPGNEGEVLELVGEDLLLDTLWSMEFAIPDVEVIFAVGVHDRVDLEARISALGYGRFNTKVLLLKFGERGALSVAPGLGYRRVEGSGSIAGGDAKDTYKGSVITAELPVIVGWQWEHVAPYVAPVFNYHRMTLQYTREATGFNPDFKRTLDYDFDIHNAGLIAGVQFKFGAFVITPEVVGNYSFSPGNDHIDMFFVYPGVSLGAAW